MLKERGGMSQAAMARGPVEASRVAMASMDLRFTPLAHRICLASGHVLTVMYCIGFLFCAQFFPIPSPDWPADRLARWLFDHKSAYQFGCLLMLVAGGLLAPWGAALSIWTRRTEVRFPVMYITQITSLAASTGLFVIIAIFWALASFRATEISVEITQMLFDAGWFLFLWVGPPFYLWAGAFGLGILINPPEHQLFPRWIGWFTLASVLCWSLGLLQVFFRTGPQSYSGMLPTWIPLIDFFVWMELLTFYGFAAIRRQEAECRAEAGEGLGVYAPTWDEPLADTLAERPQH